MLQNNPVQFLAVTVFIVLELYFNLLYFRSTPILWKVRYVSGLMLRSLRTHDWSKLRMRADW